MWAPTWHRVEVAPWVWRDVMALTMAFMYGRAAEDVELVVKDRAFWTDCMVLRLSVWISRFTVTGTMRRALFIAATSAR